VNYDIGNLKSKRGNAGGKGLKSEFHQPLLEYRQKNG